jgi:hypothetical protein
MKNSNLFSQNNTQSAKNIIPSTFENNLGIQNNHYDAKEKQNTMNAFSKSRSC